MGFDDGVEQIRGAYLKDAEDKLYKQYLVDYSNMDKEHYMSFEDYKAKAFEPQSKSKTALNKEQILSEAEKIKRLDQEGR